MQDMHLLEKYAQVLIHTGVNLQRGQRLILTANFTLDEAPPESIILVQKCVEVAYKAGAKYVHVRWYDQRADAMRLRYAETLEDWPAWESAGILSWYNEGAARLAIAGQNPDALADIAPERFQQAQKYSSQFTKPIMQKIMGDAVNWCVARVPVTGWAQRVYPDVSSAEAVDKLWAAIFQMCRVTESDPVAAWQQHVETLRLRREYMTAKQYTALHYTAPGTDLTVGLPRGHVWLGGLDKTQAGNTFTANVPTEEIFSMPHRERVNGVVSFSMPLAEQGSVVEGVTLRFEAGRVVEVTATKGKETMERWLNEDENARYLGEVALVPNSSPVSRTQTLYYDGLYDENAANHLAVGAAYKSTLTGGAEMTDDDFMAAGGNISAQHLDFMIGSGQMDVDGIREDGSAEPVMRAGEWAFE